MSDRNLSDLGRCENDKYRHVVVTCFPTYIRQTSEDLTAIFGLGFDPGYFSVPYYIFEFTEPVNHKYLFH